MNILGFKLFLSGIKNNIYLILHEIKSKSEMLQDIHIFWEYAF